MKIDGQNSLSLKRATWGQLGSSQTAPKSYCEYDVHQSDGGMPKVDYDVLKMDAGKKGSGTKNDGVIDRAAKNMAEKY